MPEASERWYEVVFGEGSTVVIRSSRASRPIVAEALGVDRAPDGSVQRVYLDRLVHPGREVWANGWRIHGAISSILEPVDLTTDSLR